MKAKPMKSKNQGVDWRVPSIINAPTGDKIAQIATPLEAAKPPIAHCIKNGITSNITNWVKIKYSKRLKR